MPSSAELQGWSRLLAGVADRVVAGTVQDMHRAISDHAFRWVGPIGRPVQEITDRVSTGVYAAVRASLRGLGEVGVLASPHLGRRTAERSPAAAKARAIVNGVIDADLLELAPELAVTMAIRHPDASETLDAGALATQYPDAGRRLVVFVHGLVDTEAVWATRGGDGPTLPEVAAELNVTPVLLRYGTGRAVGRNGADLDELLEQLVANWPVTVTELTIVGHSMGGLVARSACISAQRRGHAWVAALADIVYLGTPHLGSWLEKVANAGSWTLRSSSRSSAPLGTLLDRRSRGIKDLRFGTLAEDAWGATPIDDLLTGLVPDGPWLADVTHHLVVGRLREAPRHPLNLTFGDALVRAGSAAGAGRRRRIGDGGRVSVLSVGASHTRLVRHPEVARLLRDILAAR